MGERKALSKRPVPAARTLVGALMLAAIALSCAPTPSFAAGRRSSSGPPRARRAAKISGATEDGRLLSVSEGSWLGSSPISVTYQWELCERRRHATCNPIAGATGTTYRASTQDVGHDLVVLVTATNAEGTSTKRSRSSKTIREGSPLNLAAPEISGNLLEGTKLTAATGTWVGSAPFQFSYQWERCSILGGGCEPIEGATGVSYTPVAADLTSRLAVIVMASNIIGEASATSPETLPVEGVLPISILPPQILGLLKEGQLLSAEPGHWEGTEPITYVYQWQLCNAAGEACADIKNATEPTLKLLTGYIGDTLDVVVHGRELGRLELAHELPDRAHRRPPAGQHHRPLHRGQPARRRRAQTHPGGMVRHVSRSPSATRGSCVMRRVGRVRKSKVRPARRCSCWRASSVTRWRVW